MNPLIDLLSRKGTVWSVSVAAIIVGHEKGIPTTVLWMVAGLAAMKMLTRAIVEHKHGRTSA